MKKLIIVTLIVPFFLISCGKSDEIKTAVSQPVIEKKEVIKEMVSTSTISESGTINESGENINSLSKISSKDEKVSYSGSIEVSGEYYFDNYMGQLCFRNLKNDSLKLIPREGDDKRIPVFCFSNQEEAKKAFGINEIDIKNNVSRDADTSCTLKGNATIQISDYTVNLAETATYDKSQLIKILKKDVFQKECNAVL